MTNIKELIKLQCIKSGNITMKEAALRSNLAQQAVFARNKNNTWNIPDLQKLAKCAFNCNLYVAFKYKKHETTDSSISTLIRLQCVLSGDITQAELARRCNWSPALFSQKMQRDRWRTRDLDIVAAALNCKLIIKFTPLDPEE